MCVQGRRERALFGTGRDRNLSGSEVNSAGAPVELPCLPSGANRLNDARSTNSVASLALSV